MLTISYPYRNTPNANALSKWFAAHSPIILTATRKDDVIITTENDGSGNVKVNYTNALFFPTPGHYAYINSGAIVGTYQVISIAPGPYCIIDLAWVADTAGGWINFTSDYPNYYIKTLVQIYDPVAAAYSDFHVQKSSPFSDGIAKIDITRATRNSVNINDTFNYSLLNKRDTNLSSRLQVTFTEVWDGSANAPVVGDEMFFANAAMQTGHRFGSNMADFMPEASGADKAKWLSAAAKLRYWDGFPFDVSFIYPLALGATSMDKRESTNAGNSNIADTAYPIDVTQRGYVNRVMLLGGYNSGEDNIDVYIAPTTGGTPNPLTELINIRLACITVNPVYLKWINEDGGWHYFLFGRKQSRGLRTSIDGQFSEYAEDIALAESDSEILEKSSVPEMQLFAERLDTHDVDLMESLISSPRVMWLTNPDTWAATAARWQTVKVEAGTIPTRITRNVFNKIDFKIVFPELNRQTQ